MEPNRIEKKPEMRKAPLSREAEEALERMVKATNQGFNGGKIGKAELLSWVVVHFERETFPGVKDAIRTTYFDKVAYLAAVLEQVRKAHRDGRPEPDLDVLLAPLSDKSVSDRAD